jgi:hypothetical protein
MIDDVYSLIVDRSGSGGRNEGRSQGTEENKTMGVNANSSSK